MTRFSLQKLSMPGLVFTVMALLATPGCAQSPPPLQPEQALPANSIWLDALSLDNMIAGWGNPSAGRSIGNNPITLNKVVYPHGIGTHAVSEWPINLHGAAIRFESMVGVDDEAAAQKGSVSFEVIGDGKTLAATPVLHAGDPAQRLSVDVSGVKKLMLRVTDGGDGNTWDHADWADAYITVLPGASLQPAAYTMPPLPQSPPRLIVPAPDPKPAIHGASVIGATPGKPFLFLIPATGQGPFRYEIKNLPAGLSLNSQTGIISGSLSKAGTTVATVTVRGPEGIAERTLTIIGGEQKLAQTPPMGWNSWNVWAGNVDGAKVIAAADEMLASGLAAHGFQYINIDDTWEDGRDAQGKIQANAKFPDMKAVTGYLHAKGLKAGIYSSPGPKTCANFEGSYRHEDQDAASYADWGFDYLKYDWCSYGAIAAGDNSLDALQKPYLVMRSSLDKASRDIVYSLCQYGMGDVWKWGTQVGGNCWRTTGDIVDRWSSVKGILNAQAGLSQYAGPGHWNDPDMLVVGSVGWGNPHGSHLKPNEQITHISMWCMLSAPLLIGCDMTKLDKFTLALLTNDEALDINQDALGRPADRKLMTDDTQVWTRPLADGGRAVAIINTNDEKRVITVSLPDVGLSGRWKARDLWLHKNIGRIGGKYSVEVPEHGTVLLKLTRR